MREGKVRVQNETHSHGQQGCKVYPKKSESFQSSCYCLLVCYILGQWENE